MTEQEQAEWEERLRQAVEATLRARRQRALDRAHHAQARAHGLRQRHARKLNRPHDNRPGAPDDAPRERP